MKVAELRDKNRRDKAMFEDQAERDQPELTFLEETLGLQLDGKARELLLHPLSLASLLTTFARPSGDIVAFTFTLIDPSDHKRPFNFDLDVSEPEYSVSLCKPALPPSVTRALLLNLNGNKDFGSFARFVQGMRQAFGDLVQAEARERQHGLSR